jgi:methyltransferase OMS1
MAVAGGTVYVVACAVAYNSVQKNRADIEETVEKTKHNYSFVNDPQRTEQFQKVAEFYDNQIDRDEMAMGINLLRRALLYFHASGDVLEVGAGTGRNISYYRASSVDRVVLTDSSDQMLLQARKKLKNSSIDQPKFACLEGDSSSLNFPDQSFDTVVDTFGLCSYDDPVSVLKEMARVCKADGKILLLEHGRSKTFDFITKYLDKHAERHAKNWGCIWNRDLDDILHKAGLKLERLDTWHFGTTYYAVCRPDPGGPDALGPVLDLGTVLASSPQLLLVIDPVVTSSSRSTCHRCHCSGME